MFGVFKLLFTDGLHSKIVISNLISFYQIFLNGEAPGSKFEQEDTQIDRQKRHLLPVVTKFVPRGAHARSHGQFKMFMISRNKFEGDPP